MSQKRTYYNKYGLRPSKTITTEGLEDKVSPSTPMASLSERPRPKAPYSSSEKSATWYVAAETGQHMEYAGSVKQESNE